MEGLDALLEEHGAAALEKYFRLNALIQSDEPQLDLSSGMLVAGGAHPFMVQLLGTYSKVRQDWQWMWASRDDRLPPFLSTVARRMKAYGEQYELIPFMRPRQQVTEDDLDLLGLSVCGISQADGFFRCDYEDGAFLAVVLSPEMEKHPEIDPDIFGKVFERFSGLKVGDHRAGWKSYASYHALESDEKDGKIVTRFAGGGALYAAFSGEGRLVSIEKQACDAMAKAERDKRRRERNHRLGKLRQEAMKRFWRYTNDASEA